MKKIEAIIRPGKIDAVREALRLIGINGMTILDAIGVGSQRGYIEIFRGREYKEDFIGKVKIELVVNDEQVDDCVNSIMEAGRTGDIGDGKIFISTIDKIVRIRTGEVDDSAT